MTFCNCLCICPRPSGDYWSVSRAKFCITVNYWGNSYFLVPRSLSEKCMTKARVTQGSKNAISVHLFLVQKTPTVYKLCEIELRKSKGRKSRWLSFVQFQVSPWFSLNFLKLMVGGLAELPRNMPLVPIKFQLWLLQNFLTSNSCIWKPVQI